MAETKIEEKVEEAAKIDLFEDDDEFEEFEIGLEFEEKNEIGTDVTQEWEDDWDDDDVNDDFSVQLRKELQNDTSEEK
ncbi:hypothetical protein DCAR_0518849 [Daucus carota subsp. sativus]|uniref:26S proteasome complex subunit SEM1 n=1 Tax=Daucus carota subsp. sativus TaxID=79200 RepID=A0AAF1B031_DAUCS|nr:PREDICTED: protein DELETION OF SUV3 SUPPRESSOR 1(I)-like [Daucus carota subsp. sativus]WOG99497.1 hypothetical protein DCAR_0518849 [Daucus carota subsp. sativus]